MGANREGFNLRISAGRGNAWRSLWYFQEWKRVRKYVFRDTFSPLLCWLSGDHEYSWQPEPVNFPDELFCNWCHQPKLSVIGATPRNPNPEPPNSEPDSLSAELSAIWRAERNEGKTQ